MQIGICTTDFPSMPMEALFSSIKQMGFSSIQLAFATLDECNFIPDGVCEIPPELPESLTARIADCAKAHSLRIVCVNGTFNMAHPDAAARRVGLDRFESFAKAVKQIGCEQISLCSGTRNKDYLWAPHPDNDTAEAWADSLSSMQYITRIAESNGLTLLIETEASNVINSPEKACEMMRFIGSNHLKMIMDCANLFHAGEATPSLSDSVVNRAFDAFGQDIRLAHGKDILPGPALNFCAAGEGIVNFEHMLLRLRQCGYRGDMILHGIEDISHMPQTLAFMRTCIAANPS